MAEVFEVAQGLFSVETESVDGLEMRGNDIAAVESPMQCADPSSGISELRSRREAAIVFAAESVATEEATAKERVTAAAESSANVVRRVESIAAMGIDAYGRSAERDSSRRAQPPTAPLSAQDVGEVGA